MEEAVCVTEMMDEWLAFGPDCATPSSAADTIPTVAAVTELARLVLRNSRRVWWDQFDLSEQDNSKSDFICSSQAQYFVTGSFDRSQTNREHHFLAVNQKHTMIYHH
jgi:hypothetical protein